MSNSSASSRYLAPTTIAAPASSYSHGVKLTGGSMIIISGQVGVTPDGDLLDGFHAQCRQAWANIEAILADGGAKLDDIVKIGGIITDQGFTREFREIRESVLDHRPAATVWIGGLLDPRWLVEIEVTAHLSE